MTFPLIRLRAAWIAMPLLMAPFSLRASSCGDLSRLRPTHVTIVSAELVAAGTFTLPSGGREASPEFFTAFARLPEFCRVVAVSRPSPDSNIEMEVWLPAYGWNGRLLGVGNGSFGGSINYFRLGEALNVGFATASTNTGHRGAASDATWAPGHPEKQRDFDYRAIHETAGVSKILIRAFYGAPARWSYFSSCSTGGRQGLTEAERYPADYDGILVGAPVLRGFVTPVTGTFAAFDRRGGKLIVYHGTSDAMPVAATTQFFDSVSSRMGAARVRAFMQLYAVPKMGHCGGGSEAGDIGQWLRPGADAQHSLFVALERWVEAGIPPTGVIASSFVKDGDATSGVRQSRRVCPYRTGVSMDAVEPLVDGPLSIAANEAICRDR